MKQIAVNILALAVSVGFSTSALSGEAVTNDVFSVVALSTTGIAPVTAAGEPTDSDGDGIPDKPEGEEGDKGEPTDSDGDGIPDKPEGEEGEDEQSGDDTRPDKPGEGGEGGGEGGTPPGGGSETNVLFGVLTFDNVTTNLTGGTLSSSTANENVILAKNEASVTISNYTLNKSGDTSCEDDSNFYALNAVVAAKTNAMVYISGSTLNSNATGANCLFASGEGSTIYAYDCTITSTKGSSRGLDATYEGTVIAANLDIDTTGEHCAAFATDRGNGSVSVTNASMTTRGQGSPLIYSTGVIEVNSVTGTAWGAQIAGIEGLSTIRIRNSVLSGSAEKASEPVANGVIIYQSNSGDYTAGTATFEVSDSTLNSAITNSGAMFYITHSEAVITVQNTELNFDTSQNYLLKAAGNNGDNGWGDEGSNGAGVTFTAIDQTLEGNISVDGISSNKLYLVNSTYTGTIVKDTTYTGDGGATVFVDSNSTWTVTKSCTLKGLTAEEGAKIVDGSGNAVSIVGTDETVYVSGTSDPKITVSNYTEGDFVATNITKFAISRTAFDTMYGTSGSEEDESGGPSDVGSTYYIKPHAPTNAVVWVYHGETRLLPDTDHKYWVDAYWTNGVGVTVNLSYKADKGYLFVDGMPSTNWTVQVTENKTEIYPPAGYETAYLAQAQSGSTYYLTLEEALAAVSDRSKINLTPAAESNELAVIDSAVTNESVFAALVSANAEEKVTITTTTPGLYYWIEGGTDVSAVTNAGESVLSTDGGAVELTKPALDATKGRAFFKIAADVSAPVSSKGD